MALQDRTKELLLGALGDEDAKNDLINEIELQGDGDIKSDGSVAFTANQSLGGFKITNVQDPTSNQDAATKNYVDSHSSSGANASLSNLISTNINQPLQTADASGNTNDLTITTGFATGAGVSSGNLNLSTGGASGSGITRGDIILTPGGGTSGNIQLNAVRVNTTGNFVGGSSQNLGLQGGGNWANLYIANIYPGNDNNRVMDANARILKDSSGNSILDFSGASLDATTHSIINVVDPTNPQDAATKISSESYTAASSSDWSGSAPTTLKEALDRIAAALGPIA